MKKEQELIFNICDYFKLGKSNYLLNEHSEYRRILQVKKWTTYFIKQYTRRSYSDIASVVKIETKSCMDYIGEIGFKIRTDPQFLFDFNNINSIVYKIYKNESN